MSPTAQAIDILSPEAVADPATYFGRLRDSSPVVWDERYRSWIITRHDLVTTSLRDPRFSSDRIAPFIESKLRGPDVDPRVLKAFEILRGWMVFQDAPHHLRIRSLVRKAFTPGAVQLMEDRIRQISLELAASLPARGEFDLIAEFTYPLPALVIADLLGVPSEHRDRFKDWSEEIAPLVSGGLDDPLRYERAADAMEELIDFFEGLLAHYTEHPGDNLLTALIHARDDNDALTHLEVIATCTLLLFGGHETTANLIASSMLALIQNPEQLRALRAGEVDIRPAVEELLRWDGPGKAVVRVLADDVEIEGEVLRKGQRVFLVLAAANRDPAVFVDPDVLRLDRDTSKHVAFGHGVHFCLGSSLARLEAWVAIPILLEAMPVVGLSARHDLAWQQVFLTRGLQALWLETGSASE